MGAVSAVHPSAVGRGTMGAVTGRQMDPEELITSALAKIEEGRHAAAVGDLDAAIRLDPDNPVAHNSLALARVALGDFGGAVIAYESAIALDPGDVDARIGCAHAHVELDNRSAAIEQLRIVLAGDDQNTQALALRASCYERMGQHALAARDLSELLKQEPEADTLRLRMARSLARAELLKEAVEEFDRLLGTLGPDPEVCYDRGVAHMRLGQLRHAVNDFSLTLDIEPENSRALQNRGNCLLRLEMIEEALLDYDRLIKLGDSAVARFNRGIIHRRLGNSNRARVDFSQAVALGGSGSIANRARRYLQPD